MRRIWLRAGALVLLALGLVAGLTAYLSTEAIPPCLVTGAPAWRPPDDGETRRYELVFPDRAACFFAIDDEHELVGGLRLEAAAGISSARAIPGGVALRAQSGVYTLDLRTGRLRQGGSAPRPSAKLRLADSEHGVVYSTERDLLGFRVFEPRTLEEYVVRFKGFTWNPRFGPNPPSHGLSLAPDRPELWVLDAPNSAIHVFDVSALPRGRPRPLDDIRLSRPLAGEQNPCSRACARIGSLQHSSDGRYVYVGDAGDVIDTRTHEAVVNLEALHNSRVHLEVFVR
jgi:hypothetical protein